MGSEMCIRDRENIWQFMRQNWLSNRVFKSFDDIVDHCCYGWNTLIVSALENHVRRTPRLGNRRSFNVRIGIISSVMLLEMPFANRRTALPSAPIYATMPAPRRLTSSSLRYSSVARAQRAGARR